MTLKNLEVPKGRVDVVLDTDAYNEIDDQFAISYLLRSPERVNMLAFFAAPFHNQNSEGPEDGMLKSYAEIKKLLALANADVPVFEGSRGYLPDEHTPVPSPAADELIRLASLHTPDSPLYVVAIGAITNVASAFLKEPSIVKNTVVVWLGGHAHHMDNTAEFNMKQDVAAARVVMRSEAPFVQLPCDGVVSEFRVSGADLREWLIGKNPLADYLAKNTISAMSRKQGRPWTRVIWDVTAAAWLMNDGDRFMKSRIEKCRLPGYDNVYEPPIDRDIRYVYKINRDDLMTDLFEKLV